MPSLFKTKIKNNLSNQEDYLAIRNNLSIKTLGTYEPIVPAKRSPNFLVPVAGLVLAVSLLGGIEMISSLIFMSPDIKISQQISDKLDYGSSLFLATTKEISMKINLGLTKQETALMAEKQNINSVKYRWLSMINDFNLGLSTITQKIALTLPADLSFIKIPKSQITLNSQNPNEVLDTKSDEFAGQIQNQISNLDNLLFFSATKSVDQLALLSRLEPTDLSLVIDFYLNKLILSWQSFKFIALTKIENILDRWREFMSRPTQSQVNQIKTINREATSSVVVDLESGDISDLVKQTVIEEINRLLQEDEEWVNGDPILMDESDFSQNSDQGLVVIPESQLSTGESGQGLNLNKLQTLFSDPVDISFNQDGRSGFITPRFGNESGERYLFLLAPVK